MWGLASIPFMRLLVPAASSGELRGAQPGAWGGDTFALACLDPLPRGLGFIFIFTWEGEALLVSCSACTILGSHPLSWLSQCQSWVCRMCWCSALPNVGTPRLLPHCSESRGAVFLGILPLVYGEGRRSGRAFSCFVAPFANERSMF